MLPTLVIGLREGLEAALIVGIIAAFLRKNGKSLVPMWIGVAAAVALSVAVGVVLAVIERSLPQAAQEGMESVIGAVAVVFVTGMILWMNTHARGLKRELEAGATEAIRDGSAYALAGMAFLAVLKEGFETSVFLLATFTASGNSAFAATGAVVGVVVAVLIGVGIYAGSVRLDLGAFFRWTGAFLILVAAGLVLQSFRTAHEAGWLNIGQQQVLDLGPLARPGTVIAALLTGVLGIPADPRLIEVVGWVGYLVPVALFVYWPSRGANAARLARVRTRVVGALVVVAVAAAVAVPLVVPGGRPSKQASAADAVAGASLAPISSGASRVTVTLTGGDGDACGLSATAAKAGPVTFTIVNRSSTAITEVELQSHDRIIGEKENLAPGLAPVSFTLTLGGGTYQVYCPGAEKEVHTFTVTGKAAARTTSDVQAALTQGTAGYANYVDGVVAGLVTATKNLQTAVDSGDVAEADAKYALARPFYEKIESDVDGFVKPGYQATDNAGNLDYLIDMRASNLDPAVGWHGFHAIERDLFQAKAITPGTKALAAELTANVEELARLATSLTYRPEDLANGAAGLLEEVQTEKVTGEEEAFSHYDLIDLAANVEGAEQAFAFLEPGMKKIDPALSATITAQFAKVDALLDTFRDPNGPGGFQIYTPQLRQQEAGKLSQAVQALQVPLSTIAEKVATAS